MVRIPILMYHKIDKPPKGETKRKLYVPPRLFAQQMWYLHQANCKPINMAQLAACMRGEEHFPDKPVVITFDDGYESVYTNAVPILHRFGFTATVYIVADLIGKTNEWDAAHGLTIAPLMNLEQIRDMVKYRIDIGAHTFSHPHLAQIAMEDAVHEIRDCKGVLEGLIQKPVDTFCYTFGPTSFSQELRQVVVDSGYKAACTTAVAGNTPDTDTFALNRVMPRRRTYIPNLIKLLNIP